MLPSFSSCTCVLLRMLWTLSYVTRRIFHSDTFPQFIPSPLFCYIIHKIAIRFRHWSSRQRRVPLLVTYRKTSSRIIGKVKCTLVQALRLCTGCTAHRGSRGIALLFHDHGTRRGEGSASRPGRSLPQGKTRYPLCRRLRGPQARSGQVRKISPSPGFNPRTVQPVASRYTDYATRPLQQYYAYNYMSNYSCFIVCIEFHVACMETKICCSCTHQVEDRA